MNLKKLLLLEVLDLIEEAKIGKWLAGQTQEENPTIIKMTATLQIKNMEQQLLTRESHLLLQHKGV